MCCQLSKLWPYSVFSQSCPGKMTCVISPICIYGNMAMINYSLFVKEYSPDFRIYSLNIYINLSGKSNVLLAFILPEFESGFCCFFQKKAV